MVDRKHRDFTEEDIFKIADTFAAFQDGKLEDVKGFCAVASTQDIAKQDYILTPRRYVGIKEQEDDGEPFEEKMARLTYELSDMFAKSHELEEEIRKKLGRLGMKYRLSDICDFVKRKVDVASLARQDYISAENMMPNKGGVDIATTLPLTDQTQQYLTRDVLVSNIRPYFKKIWHSTKDGGCSNDVLVFRVKEGISPVFLYYVLADDTFFDYAAATSKGTKTPRGDKKAIMEYVIPNFDLPTQHKIGGILRLIDDKIAINTSINKNLEEQLEVLFVELFSCSINDSSTPKVKLGDLIQIVDNRGKTPPLSLEQTDYPIIDVKALSGTSRIVNFNNCTKYVNEEIYNSWFRSGHPKPNDILISTVGSLAEMKIFLGYKGCIAQNVVGIRSNKVSPFYLYQYLNYIKSDLVAYNIGSVQPSIKITHILKHEIFVPNEKEMQKFTSLATLMTQSIYNNCLEVERLSKCRDILLPKLMNGEIDVSNINI